MKAKPENGSSSPGRWQREPDVEYEHFILYWREKLIQNPDLLKIAKEIEKSLKRTYTSRRKN